MHVGIIPDGNRRWAKEKGLPVSQGYIRIARKSQKKESNISQIVSRAKKLGVTTLSLWVFSTENWTRPQKEQDTLFTLLKENLVELQHTLQENNAQFLWLGRRDKVDLDIRESLEALEQKQNKGELLLQLCLDYGGRNEILRAVNKAVDSGKEQTTESFEQLLDSHNEPDLIIRTSGEQRLSGFMPWQAAYAELFFVKKHFPDFTADDLEQVIKEFSLRSRRYGGA